MGGLLTRVVGGALTGAGAAMVDQAKQQREDALLAMKRGQEVEDRNAGYAQQDKIQGVQEAGQDSRLATSEAGATTRTGITEAGANTRLGISEAAANARTAASEAGANSRTAATIKGQKDAAEAAAGRYGKPEADQNGNLIATNQNGKAITIVGADGKSVMAPNSKIPGTAMKVIADKSLDADGNFDMATFMSNLQQAEKVYGPGGQNAALPPPTQAPSGGYLSNLWGAVTGSPNQAPATGGGLVRSPDSKNAVGPAAQPPTGFKQGTDGGYYAPDPKRPGKFLKWTP